MTAFISRQIVRKVTEVARKTAIFNSPIIEGTVISRNPDGTLNVDDGRGGCLRQAPAANVRVGQKIKLGVEPALGSQTSLPLVQISLDASTVPCPDDPRRRRVCEDLIGVPCSDSEFTFVAEARIYDDSPGNFTLDWADSENVGGDPQAQWLRRNDPGALAADDFPAFPFGVLGLIHSSRYPLDYTGGAFPPDTIVLFATRQFVEFDTSSIPPGAIIQSVTLRCRLDGNQTQSDQISNEQTSPRLSLCVVPSTADGTTGAYNWNAFLRVPLAELTVDALIAAGQHPPAHVSYDVDFALEDTVMTTPNDPIGMNAFISRTGPTRFAIISGHDLRNNVPQVAAPFVNADNSPPNPYNDPRQVISHAFQDGDPDAVTKLIIEYSAGGNSTL